MAGITLAQAEAKLQTWLDADEALAAGKTYTIGTGATSRTVTLADEAEVQERIDKYNRMVKRLSRGGGIKVRRITPV